VKNSFNMRLRAAPEKKRYSRRTHICGERFELKRSQAGTYICMQNYSIAHWDQGVFLCRSAAGDFLLPLEGKKSTLNLPSAAGAVFVANYTRRVANKCTHTELRRRVFKQEIRGLLHLER
jgi:hypothetical protein